MTATPHTGAQAIGTLRASRRRELDHQLERIGWALFLIMIGGLGLLPAVPSGTWLIGTGLILLGLNAVRSANGIPVRRFWVLLGIAAIGFGGAQLVGVELPIFPILLIVMGVSLLWPTPPEPEAEG